MQRCYVEYELACTLSATLFSVECLGTVTKVAEAESVCFKNKKVIGDLPACSGQYKKSVFDDESSPQMTFAQKVKADRHHCSGEKKMKQVNVPHQPSCATVV